MKLKNTSRFPTHAIRRMVGWICREIGMKPPALAEFRNRTWRAYSGRAYWTRRIVVSIGPDSYKGGSGAIHHHYPMKHRGYKRACLPAVEGSDYPTLHDSIDTLVMVTAHELGHICHFRLGHTGRGCEAKADAMARMVYRKWREQREALWAGWTATKAEPAAEPVAAEPTPAPTPMKIKPDLIAQRRAKAEAMLARWTRRLKLATTKCRKYRRTVRRYETLNRQPVAAHA